MTSFDSQQSTGSVAPVPPYPYLQIPWWYASAPPQRTAIGRTALVLGILSFICFGPLTGIPAIIFGVIGQRHFDQGRAASPSVARAGMILGILNTVWTAAIIVAIAYKFF